MIHIALREGGVQQLLEGDAIQIKDLKKNRHMDNVSRCVHELEAAVSAAGYILNSKEKEV